MEALTDKQLIDLMRDGEAGAMDELYRRYSKKLYAFCGNLARSEDPEDMVHDVFMKVIESIDRFNPKKASFNTWLFRIAHNHCIDVIRRSGKAKFISIDDETEISIKDTFADDNADVEDSVVRASLIENIRECIGELKEQERSAIVLYYMGDKVYREISKIMGKSISMVKKHLKSAQGKVKICLERKGINSFT